MLTHRVATAVIRRGVGLGGVVGGVAVPRSVTAVTLLIVCTLHFPLPSSLHQFASLSSFSSFSTKAFIYSLRFSSFITCKY